MVGTGKVASKGASLFAEVAREILIQHSTIWHNLLDYRRRGTLVLATLYVRGTISRMLRNEVTICGALLYHHLPCIYESAN